MNNATFAQRNAQLDQLYNEISNYAQKNNMVRVYVCLPLGFIPYKMEYFTRFHDVGTHLKMHLSPFFAPYRKTDRFIDSTEFGIDTYIDIPKGGIRKIKESTKMQDYFSDNSKNDMMVIRYNNGYAIISPERFSHIEHEGNPEKIIGVDKTPFIVWLKEDELFSFLKSYNDFIKELRILYHNTIEEDKRKFKEFELKYTIRWIIKRYSPFLVIGGIFLLILLFQMCSN